MKTYTRRTVWLGGMISLGLLLAIILASSDWSFRELVSSRLPASDTSQSDSKGLICTSPVQSNPGGKGEVYDPLLHLNHPSLVASPDDAYIELHSDWVPNFAQQYSAINIADGMWSNPDTWRDGNIPEQDAIVRIAANTKVIYDLVSDARIHSIGIAGHLEFSNIKSTRMRMTNMLIYPQGKLQIGSLAEPLHQKATAEIIINDAAIDMGTARQPGTDPGQYGHGILVLGAINLHGAELTPTFIRLSEELGTGAKQLQLSTLPRGWKIGNRLALPRSQRHATENIQISGKLPAKKNKVPLTEPLFEIVEIEKIEGLQVQLSQPVQLPHTGAKNLAGKAIIVSDKTPLLPHVANITRNIIIRSENKNGTRGHTIFFRDAVVDVRNTLFKDLGRTTVAPLDNTVFDTEHNVIKIGHNQIARYPVHFHHFTDPLKVKGENYEYSFIGNVVETAPRWGIVIHSTHYGLVKDNIIFGAAGAGIATEDGSETGNRFEHNFIFGVSGSGQQIGSREPEQGLGHEGDGFWMGSDNNILINNVVAAVRSSGYALFRSKASLPYPEFPNITASGTANVNTLIPEYTFKFLNNEVYASENHGIELWDDEKRKPGSKLVRLENTRIWHSANGVNFDYHADRYEVDGLIVRGNPGNALNSTGILANQSRQATIRNADIKFVTTGLEGGGARNRRLTFENSEIQAETGIRIFRGSSWGKRAPLKIDNVIISVTNRTGSDSGGKLIELKNESNYKRPALALMHRPIHITRFQADPEQNFDLFYPDQSADFILPQHQDNNFGCPDSGLSNAQCMNQYGIAMGGEIAPCNQSHPDIDGFSCSVD